VNWISRSDGRQTLTSTPISGERASLLFGSQLSQVLIESVHTVLPRATKLLQPLGDLPPGAGGCAKMSWRHSKHIMGRVRQTASVDMKGCRAPLVLRGGASLRCIGTIKMSTIVICHQHDQFRFLNRAKRFFYPCPSDMEQNSSYPQPEYRPVPEPWNSLRALSPTHPSMEAYSRWPSSRLLGQLPPRRKHRSLGSFVPKGWEQVGPQTFDSMTRPVTESIVPESNRFGRR
jgi:hypothetical protein